MKNSSLIVVYGSYGYTGKLIVNICRTKNLQVVLAGRNEKQLKMQSQDSGYSYQVVESSDSEGLKKLLTPAAIVIHCGGPFRYTAKTMSDACLAANTHYTDITGEYQVFESLLKLDQKAKELNITIMPGTGFDVVPSDCLALRSGRAVLSPRRLRTESVSVDRASLDSWRLLLGSSHALKSPEPGFAVRQFFAALRRR